MEDQSVHPPLGPPSLPPEPKPPGEPDEGRPWGFWATIGFSLAVAGAGLMTQILALSVVAMIVVAWTGNSAALDNLEASGLVLGLATIAGTPVVVGLCLFFAWLRKGIRMRSYLGLQWPRWRVTLAWSGVVVLMIVASDTITTLLGRPIVPEVMVEVYRTSGFAPLLWLAIIVAAPLGEEFLFRGFLFAGLQRSRIGPWGAILLTALTWAVIHLQYDHYEVATIFVAGILLGYARWKTGSMLLCVTLHALMNTVATVQAEVLLRIAAP